MPIFAASPVALDVVLLIGGITAFIAATIALVQNDIKKVMAYSTISQLGYMMIGLGAGGVGGQTAGMFHLVTHAFFKALLFLTAFYVARMWLLAFWGEPRTEDARHAHESPAVMTLPLWLLAIPSVVLGWVLHQNGAFTSFLAGQEAAVEHGVNWLIAGPALVL